MSTPIRHVEVDPDASLDDWPYEALVTLIERGTVRDWARITGRVRDDPWGPVARQVEDYLGYAESSGVTALLGRAVGSARTQAEMAERAAVADEVAHLVARSGLSAGEFALRLGTSASRLSTYRSGKVVPSATLLLRMRRVSGATDGADDLPGWRYAARPGPP